jgi:hypothetical protein
MANVVAAVTAAVAAVFVSVGVSAATAAVLATFIVNTAITYGISATVGAFAPKPKSQAMSDPGAQLRFASDPNAPRMVVYGETAIGGHILKSAVSGADNKYLCVVAALGDGGPYEAVQSVKLNNETVTLDGSGNVTSPSKWASKALINTTLGTASQAALANAVLDVSGWTSAHQGKGVALAYLRFEYDPEVWTSGAPTPKFIVRGRKVYDPRLDSSPGADPTNASYIAWSQNPALWILDYLLGVKGLDTAQTRIMGLGIPVALVDWQSFADAAAVCDEAVNVDAGGTIARYTGGGGVVSANDDPLSVIQAMLASMGGVLTTRSGKAALFAGEAQTASVTLTDDDLAGAIKIVSARSIRETANAVAIQYREPSQGYEMAGAAPYTNAAWVTEDGSEVLYTTLNLPFTDDHRQAQRLAKIYAGDKREPRTIEANFKIKALQVQEGEVFTLASDSYGSAANGKYRLLSRKWNPNGTVDITARSETDAKYAWDETTEEQPAPAGTIAATVDPTTQAPTGWTATPSEVNGPQGSTTTVIDIAPGGTIPPTITGVDIQVQRQAGAALGLDFSGGQFATNAIGVVGDDAFSTVASLTRDQASSGFRLPNVERARGYSVRIRYRSPFSISGSWQTIEVAVPPAGSAIAAPSGWAATATTLPRPEGYNRPVLRVAAPLSGVPEAAAVVSIDRRKTTEASFSDQLILSRAEASAGRYISVDHGVDYIVRVRYGADASTWGPASFHPVSTSGAAAVALGSFAVAANAATAGSYTLPGFRATWAALSGDELQRARAIAIQYRLNGTTIVTTLYTEKDETEKSVHGLLAAGVYNVRARVEDVFGGGSWSSWANVTAGSAWVVGTAVAAPWTGITSRPANLSSLGGTEPLLNSAITIDGDGVLSGIGTASITVNNNSLTVGNIPSLPTSKITSGTFGEAFITDNAVSTAKIAANAVTSADSTTTDYDLTDTATTQVEIARHVQTLTSGSKAIIDVRIGGQSAISGAPIIYTVGSGSRDLIIRLLRDPDGTPVEVDTRVLKASAGGSVTSTLYSYSFISEDTGHSGGSTTYAIVITSYTAGTTTLNATTLDVDKMQTTINLLEAKR